jgi:hypothetical protein
MSNRAIELIACAAFALSVSACAKSPGAAAEAAPAVTAPAEIAPSEPAPSEPAPSEPATDDRDARTSATAQMPMFAELSPLGAPSAGGAAKPLSAYLGQYFADACGPDPRFSVDRICRSAPAAGDADPSGWPQLLLAIDGERVVSAVLTAPGAALAAPWACEPCPQLEALRLCFPADTAPADRSRWTQEWVGFFQAAD